MSIRVLIVGRPSAAVEEIDAAAAAAVSVPPRFFVERCGPPAALWPVLRDIVLREEAKIDVLDIFDHADRGVQKLSDERLFDYQETGFPLATKIAQLLTPDAHVRLLGCTTALGQQGKDLLIGLQRAFGRSVVVYGTLGPIRGDVDFDEGGFCAVGDESKLYSSTEARAAALPPGWAERTAELIAWRDRIKAMAP
jgi:hypothetical protein